MTSAYVPTAEFTDSATLVADGDAADATNLNLGAKKALDRCAMLRGATDGLLVWNGRARVGSGGTNNGSFAVYCPAIEAVSLLDGTTWKAFSLASETQLTSAFHFSSGTLANSTVYYVYGYVSAGALALVVSTDAPGADGIWKTSATGTHRYLFAFVTGSSGAAIPMSRSSGGVYRYRVSAQGVTPITALSGGTATSFTNISLTTLIPTTARLVTIYSVCENSSTTAHGQAQYRTDGDSGGYIEQGVAVADASNNYRGVQIFDIEHASRVIEYRRNNSSGYASISVNVYVYGWVE
jgi:hypothetical protein